MHIIDSHFHWWPRSVSDSLCKRKTHPRAEVNNRGGYTYLRQQSGDYILNSWAEWFDLDKQFEHMDGLGHQVDVVCSIGPLSVAFSDLAPQEGRDLSLQWNEEMAGAQRKYPGRLWASAAVPLTRKVSSVPGTRNIVPTWGLARMFLRLNISRLPLRSGIRNVCSSSTATKPGLSPLGEASWLP